MTSKRILIVDDDSAIREMIRMGLEIAGFNCLEASTVQQAHSLIVDHAPDLVLLDWMLPGVSGIDFLRRLKRDELTAELPVILLTAKAEEHNKIQGLDVGADDYITKPFAPKEMLSRIKAVLRRTGYGEEEQAIVVLNVKLDPSSHRVYIKDQPVKIGPTEFKLLKFFMTHQERAYSRGQLLDQVWGGNVYVDERTVDVHIRRLRKALCIDQFDYGNLVQTVRGTGYRFSVQNDFSVSTESNNV